MPSLKERGGGRPAPSPQSSASGLCPRLGGLGSRNVRAPAVPEHRLHPILQQEFLLLDGHFLEFLRLTEKPFPLELMESCLAAFMGFHKMAKFVVLALQDLPEFPEIGVHGGTSSLESERRFSTKLFLIVFCGLSYHLRPGGRKHSTIRRAESSQIGPHHEGVLPGVTIVPFSTSDHPESQLLIEPQGREVGRPDLEACPDTPPVPPPIHQMPHEPGSVSLAPRRLVDSDVVDSQLAVHHPDVGIGEDL